MAAFAREQENDSLSSLEERITRAVELVSALRNERDEMASMLAKAESERDAAVVLAQKSIDELDHLRSERKQVRTRIEKLLGQMDVLNGG
jgi:FtsZ-binding cell division protein ZapB